MTTARTSVEHATPAAGGPEQVARRHSRASGLFEDDHAYAARLVKIATAIGCVVRSVVAARQPDEDSSAMRENNGITTGSGDKPRTQESGR